MLLHAELTETILGAAIEVHRELGPGLLESVYAACLGHELQFRGIQFQREVPVSVRYKGLNLDCGYRIDLLVENSVLLELKSVEQLLPVHEAQLMTYLKLCRLRVGLLINFNVPILKNGIVRRAI